MGRTGRRCKYERGFYREIDSDRARRKQDPGLIETALKGEWHVAAVLASVALIGMLVIPSLLVRNIFLQAFVPIFRGFTGVAAIGFAAVACVKFLNAKKAASEVVFHRRRTSAATRRPMPVREVAEVMPRVEPRSHNAPSVVATRPDRWSLELLQSIDWKLFEEVVAAYFREKNFRSETIACGPDGGVDVRLYFRDDPVTVGVVQCKAWGKSKRVGVAEVRELLGVMAHEKVPQGYFAATGEFSDDAITFAKANPIVLITGTDFITAIAKMDSAKSARLLAVSTEGDVTTPSCPSCGEKLYRRTFKRGSVAWVCRRYPKCKTRIRSKAPV